MIPMLIKSCGIVALLLLTRVTAHAGGLYCRMGEVWLENVRYGQEFSMRNTLNMPLQVTNTWDKYVEITMDVQTNKPGDPDLKPGYEPLPDPSWVKLEKEYFPRVAPSGVVETDVIISIPKDKKYLGKRYQYYVGVRSIGGIQGLNVGIKCRYLVTVISAGDMAELEGQKRPETVKANLDFNLLPYEIFAKQLKPGKRYDLETLAGTPVKVVNPSGDKLKFRITALTSQEAKTYRKAGYDDIPDAGCITFKDREFSVPGESIKRIKDISVLLPDKPEYRGKRYQCIIALEAVGQDVNARVFSRLYITTEE